MPPALPIAPDPAHAAPTAGRGGSGRAGTRNGGRARPTRPPTPGERSGILGSPGDARDLVLFRRMTAIRRFEETLLRLFDEGALHGTTHCSIGQEADAAGVLGHLLPGDHVFSNHRGHGHWLMRTGDAVGLFAEILGRRSGVCGGAGGSQHLAADGFKSNGIQGGIVPAAAGIALANSIRGDAGISTVFIGDGTLGEGVVYETLNMASLWRLPLWIVVEDNGWAQSTPLRMNLAGSIPARFRAFGVPVRELDTTDVTRIDAAAGEEVALLRRDGGPRALVLHTYRLCHHSKNDDDRPRAEVEARRALDPLTIHGARLRPADRDRIRLDVDAALARALGIARSLP